LWSGLLQRPIPIGRQLSIIFYLSKPLIPFLYSQFLPACGRDSFNARFLSGDNASFLRAAKIRLQCLAAEYFYP